MSDILFDKRLKYLSEQKRFIKDLREKEKIYLHQSKNNQNENKGSDIILTDDKNKEKILYQNVQATQQMTASTAGSAPGFKLLGFSCNN